MKGFLKKLVTRVAKGQGGFTLIEMIVVVGIIAVLAAVIVPNIGKFIGFPVRRELWTPRRSRCRRP